VIFAQIISEQSRGDGCTSDFGVAIGKACRVIRFVQDNERSCLRKQARLEERCEEELPEPAFK